MVRGAKIDYVNRNGKTALHICVENKITEAVKFLLSKGANPHIMDLEGHDTCDKAKSNGLAIDIPQFNNCNIHKKVIPLLPHGEHADVLKIPLFRKQEEEILELAKVSLQPQPVDRDQQIKMNDSFFSQRRRRLSSFAQRKNLNRE